MTGKEEFKTTYSKEAKEYIEKQKVEEFLHDFQGFIPQDMVRVYHNKLNDFIVDKMSTSIKASADVLIDEKKLEKWAEMCIRLENMSKEQIEDIAIRHYIEKLEKRKDKELAKYKRAFEILKRELNIQIFFDNEWGEPMWVLDGGGNKEITQEEYELLEELLND